MNLYKMPAEWEPHSAVWLAWPHDKISFGTLNQKNDIFNPERLPNTEMQFIKIIAALAQSERVELLVLDQKMKERVIAKLAGISNVNFHIANYADVWTRDYLPIFVKNHEHLEVVKWEYDAYGEKFETLVKDNKVWSKLSDNLKINTTEPKIILEAGAIEVNGQGALLTTEQCLLNRYPKLTKAAYEKALAQYLGVSKVIWLKQGLINDHTDGHIDELARFVSPNKIVMAFEDDPADENYQTLKDNFEQLSKEEFEIIKLPMPHMQYDDGKKAPVSYANFYIANNAVLVPIFNDPNDRKALEIIQHCFPDRKVIGIDATDLIYGGGTVHCMTQQQPA